MTHHQFYTGGGTPETPPPYLIIMAALARRLSRTHILRSGGENGAPSALQEGAEYQGELMVPIRGYNGSHSSFVTGEFDNESIERATRVCAEDERVTNFSAVAPKSQQIMIRNTFLMLGRNLDSPSSFLIFYLPGMETSCDNGVNSMGHNAAITAHLLRTAERFSIKAFNVARSDHLERFSSFLTRAGGARAIIEEIGDEWRESSPSGLPVIERVHVEEAMKILGVAS